MTLAVTHHYARVCRVVIDPRATVSSVKILLSAFSCEPWRGSELEVGFRTMLAAAEQHEVWVLTSATGMPRLSRFVDDHALRSQVHLLSHPAVPPGEDEGRLGLINFHRMYDQWQRRVTRVALELDRAIDFDVVHHVTIATVWTRAGVAAVEKPLVWGPVGGAVHPPLSLVTELGWRGAAEDLVRVVARRALARLPHARVAARRALVAFAQNAVTARLMRTSAPVTVLPNSTAVDVTHVSPPRERTSDLMFVGRLLPWKGTMLALRAFRELARPTARLRFFGTGPDQDRLEWAAHRWGIRDRVRFEGWQPRDAMLAELAQAAALIHPSLHDEAGLSVAEALLLGTPAVCLDHGGPAAVVRLWPDAPAHLITAARPSTTARRLAAAMDDCLVHPAPVPPGPFEPATSYRAQIQRAYEQAAAAPRRTRSRRSSADPDPSPDGTTSSGRP